MLCCAISYCGNLTCESRLIFSLGGIYFLYCGMVFVSY
jgi:hypothetical protein